MIDKANASPFLRFNPKGRSRTCVFTPITKYMTIKIGIISAMCQGETNLSDKNSSAFAEIYQTARAIVRITIPADISFLVKGFIFTDFLKFPCIYYEIELFF